MRLGAEQRRAAAPPAKRLLSAANVAAGCTVARRAPVRPAVSGTDTTSTVSGRRKPQQRDVWPENSWRGPEEQTMPARALTAEDALWIREKIAVGDITHFSRAE